MSMGLLLVIILALVLALHFITNASVRIIVGALTAVMILLYALGGHLR